MRGRTKSRARGNAIIGVMGRSIQALLLLASLAIAQNRPRFAFMTIGLLPAAMAVDPGGNTYLTGQIIGNGLMATPGAYQTQNNAGVLCPDGTGFGPPILSPCANTWIIKLDPSGAVVFATYLGGTGSATPNAIALGAQQNIYIAGQINYGSFPLSHNAAFSTGVNFIAKLNRTGAALDYATLIPGGGSGTYISSIEVDSQGNLLFAGTGDPTFPATPGAYQSSFPIIAGISDNLRAVAGKLNAAGTALVWATYLSDASLGFSLASSIATDTAGNVLVAGTGAGPDGASANQTAFLDKLTPDGSQLLSETILTAPGNAGTLKASASGDIYVICNVTTSKYPAVAPGFGVPLPAPVQGVFPPFLFHLASDGATVLSTIYLPFFDAGMDVDSAGNVYLTGIVFSNGPFVAATEGAFQSTYGGGNADAVVAKITPSGEIAGFTYLGGEGDESDAVIGVERNGSVVIAGRTDSAAFLGSAATGGAMFAANLFPAITVENSASYAANRVAAGEKVAIQGYGIGPAVGAVSSPASTLGGVQVYFDSFAAPLIYSQSNQINVQAPWEIMGQSSTTLRIVFNGVEAGTATVPVAAAQPGVFYVTNADGSFNTPSNPAHPGDLISAFGTGGGGLNLPGVTGNPWPLAPLSSLLLPVSAVIGGEDATVLYSGSAPTLDSGFFQINLRVPADSASNTTLCLIIGGVAAVPTSIAVTQTSH
jgi:uncharacterized protein (TIGR03437 family)